MRQVHLSHPRLGGPPSCGRWSHFRRLSGHSFDPLFLGRPLQVEGENLQVDIAAREPVHCQTGTQTHKDNRNIKQQQQHVKAGLELTNVHNEPNKLDFYYINPVVINC